MELQPIIRIKTELKQTTATIKLQSDIKFLAKWWQIMFPAKLMFAITNKGVSNTATETAFLIQIYLPTTEIALNKLRERIWRRWKAFQRHKKQNINIVIGNFKGKEANLEFWVWTAIFSW